VQVSLELTGVLRREISSGKTNNPVTGSKKEEKDSTIEPCIILSCNPGPNFDLNSLSLRLTIYFNNE
jgi:hypothetical protein